MLINHVPVDILTEDMNGAEQVLASDLRQEWDQLNQVLRDLPPHWKLSRQKGKDAILVFDPVGTNAAITQGLARFGWNKASIPQNLKPLGKDVDFVRSGLLVESQFSHYGLFLNNLLRSEVFYKLQVRLGEKAPRALIVVTKCHLFDAAQSSLYYEQAVTQMRAIRDVQAETKIITIPTRIVGLTISPDRPHAAVVSTYATATARVPTSTKHVRCGFRAPGTRARGQVEILP